MIGEQILPGDRHLILVQGDLTEEKVDAIVNAANAHLAHGGGVAGAIVRRGGAKIQAESDAWVRQNGLVSHAQPALTGGGRLPCCYVIHAVGPVWGEGDEDEKLKQAILGALALASEHRLASLAMPALSTGIFGFPKARAARLIVESVVDYLSSHPQSSLREVRLVLYDQPSLDEFTAEFRRRWPESILQI